MTKKPDNAAIHESQRRQLAGPISSIDWGSSSYIKQSNKMYAIQVTMQSCLDAGAPPDLLRQLIAMYRRHYVGDEQMQSFINDAEVRYITSQEGYTP